MAGWREDCECVPAGNMLDGLLDDLNDAGVGNGGLGLEGVVGATVLDGVEEGSGGDHLCGLG